MNCSIICMFSPIPGVMGLPHFHVPPRMRRQCVPGSLPRVEAIGSTADAANFVVSQSFARNEEGNNGGTHVSMVYT